METHNPWVRMAERELTFTSRYCQDNCLENDPHVEMRQPPEPDEDAELFNVNGFEIDDEDETSDTDREAELFRVDGMTYTDPREYVPEELHKYLDVFDDRWAKTMPMNRNNWNFEIDFIEGWEKKLPKPAKRYRLTEAEQQAELETLQELQDAGMIRLSRSPLAAPTFFRPKKDGGKRYIVDWRGINAITIKDAYPLLLLDDLLDMAQGASIMSKFDLMASYNQIPIREKD